MNATELLASLMSAAQALGVVGDGYCFCAKNRDPDKAEHEPECHDLRNALEAVLANQANEIRTDNADTLSNALAENEQLHAELAAIMQAAQAEPVAWYSWSSPPDAPAPICSVTFRKEDVTPMHVPLYAHPQQQARVTDEIVSQACSVYNACGAPAFRIQEAMDFRMRADIEAVAPLLAAQPRSRYSIDDDELGIRARVADAITGALAFGAQGNNAPPPWHWLAPFWDAARAEASKLPAQPEPSVPVSKLRELVNAWLEDGSGGLVLAACLECLIVSAEKQP